MFRSAALLLLVFVSVTFAQAPGSVTVFRRLVTWEFDGTKYDITSNQEKKNGEGPFFDPKKLRFRIPNDRKIFRLPATFKLGKSVRRVKNFRVNGNTFTIRYNRRGTRVKRVVCTRGPCDFRRGLTKVEGAESADLDEDPVDRSLQREIGWSCDACDDFWSTMCNDRGIALLCGDRGLSEVRQLDDPFARRAVNSLCDPLAETCELLEDGDPLEICERDFGASDCPVFESLRF